MVDESSRSELIRYESERQSLDQYTIKDYGWNSFKALLKGIPYVGSALEQFISGPSQERRWRRVERTLNEVAQKLEELQVPPEGVAKEEYAELLIEVTPSIAAATNEDRRQRFRDLLVSTAQLPSGAPAWEETKLMAKFIDEIDGPGLALMAAASAFGGAPTLWLSPRPTSQLLNNRDDGGGEGRPTQGVPLAYDYGVLEEWALRLTEKRLLHKGQHSEGLLGLRLTALGRAFVRWAVAEGSVKAEEPARKAT